MIEQLDDVGALRVEAAWTVGEVVRRHPGSAVVLEAFGIDTRNGGAESLGVAARVAGLDAVVLAQAVEAALVAQHTRAARLADANRRSWHRIAADRVARARRLA